MNLNQEAQVRKGVRHRRVFRVQGLEYLGFSGYLGLERLPNSEP